MKNLSNYDGYETPAVCGSKKARCCIVCGKPIRAESAHIDVSLSYHVNSFMHTKCARKFAQEVVDCCDIEETMPPQNREVICVLRLRKMSQEG